MATIKFINKDTLNIYDDERMQNPSAIAFTIPQLLEFYSHLAWIEPDEEYGEEHGNFLASVAKAFEKEKDAKFEYVNFKDFCAAAEFVTVQKLYANIPTAKKFDKTDPTMMTAFYKNCVGQFLAYIGLKILVVKENTNAIDFAYLKPNTYVKLNQEVMCCEKVAADVKELAWKRLPELYEDCSNQETKKEITKQIIQQYGKSKSVREFALANMGKYHNLLPYVPDVDETFVYREDYIDFIKLFTQKGFHKILLTGDPGVGKSELVQQLCARMRLPFMRVDFSGEITPDQFLWSVDFNVATKQLEVKEGILPFCLRNGVRLLLDEFSAIPPSVAFELHRVMEHGTLFIKDNQTLIKPHPMFTIVLADNRIGNPNFGKFSGTMQQNAALISRIEAALWVDYPSKREEMEMLERKFPQLQNLNIINKGTFGGAKLNMFDALLNFVTDVRKRYRAREFSFTIAPREVVYFLKNFLVLGDLRKAFDYTVLNFNKAFENDVKLLTEAFITSFGEHPEIDQMQSHLVEEVDIAKYMTDGAL